jgi:hypothetical protein
MDRVEVVVIADKESKLCYG